MSRPSLGPITASQPDSTASSAAPEASWRARRQAALVVQPQVGDALVFLHQVHHPRQVTQGFAGVGHLFVQQAAHGEGIERYAGGQLALALGVPAARRVALALLRLGQQRDTALGRPLKYGIAAGMW